MKWDMPVSRAHPTTPPRVQLGLLAAANLLAAVGWRLRRNYLWIYAAVLLTWVAKLEIIGGGYADLIGGAAIGRIPGEAVWALVVAAYAAMVAVGVLANRTYPMGSEAAQAVLRQEPD